MNVLEIPGYQSAQLAERELRDFAFLGWDQDICGISVKLLTLALLSELSFIRSPFISGGIPRMEHFAQFMWVISTARAEARTARIEFVDSLRPIDAATLLAAIREYLEDTFQDAPPSAGEKIPVVALAASVADTICREYGWSEESVMKMPIARLYQYYRCITRYHSPNAVIFNRKSDKARGDYLRKLNGDTA